VKKKAFSDVKLNYMDSLRQPEIRSSTNHFI